MKDYTYALMEYDDWGMTDPVIILSYDEEAKTLKTFSLNEGVQTEVLTDQFSTCLIKVPDDMNYLFSLLITSRQLGYALYKIDYKFRKVINTICKNNPYQQLLDKENKFWELTDIRLYEENEDRYEIRCLRKQIAQLEEKVYELSHLK